MNRGESGRQAVVFVRDVSRSAAASAESARAFFEQAQQHRGEHLVRFVDFAGQPGEVPAEPALAEQQPGKLDPLQSDPGGALLLAAGLLPPDEVGKIVLATDGRETQGDLFSVAGGVKVPVHVVPLKAFSAPEVSVERVVAPPRVRPQVPFDVEVVVAANRAGPGTVQLARNGERIDSREVDLVAGENRVRFRTSLADGPGTALEATAETPDDSLADNNRRRAVVVAEPSPTALLVAGDPGLAEPVREVLGGAGFRVTPVRRPNEIPANDRLLAGLDLVVLFDVPPGAVSDEAAAALGRYVQAGGGLIVAGGRNTFDAQAFAGSKLEPILPVNALERREEGPPVLALVLVIDRSTSMDDPKDPPPPGEKSRMELAKIAAQKTVNVLSDRDKVGVLVFGSNSSWNSDLARLTDRPQVLQRISQIQASGVTNMYPALEKAFVALQQVDADRRSVIVLTDGAPSPGDFDRLARAMGEARIRVSTVTVGAEADQTVMQSIADLAGGNYEHCADPNDVPRILEREARLAAEPPADIEFRPITSRRLPELDVESVPRLAQSSCAATTPKQESEVLLVTADGDPLLSWWRCGRGVAVAATSAETAGNPRWRTWPGYAGFWTQLARLAVRQTGSPNVAVDLSDTGEGICVTLDARQPGGGLLNEAEAVVQVVAAEGDRREFPLPQIAPGADGRSLDLDRPGRYDLEIKLARAGETLHEERRGICLDYPAELQLGDANETLLKNVARVTGGTYDPKPAGVFADDGRRVVRTREWWTGLVMAALVLFVVDVALRGHADSVRAK